ncbi:microtubule-associated serine/threonine-protein kinase 3-like isoform X3 [Tachypleus tridentatus]|uniref:microtubule-associated serine/threonine-protein kinase 3-like isoform X3 n=1 Tax=Tachypleus tridentatus TaxID=6853 RepID=UPI003FD3901F
MRKKKCWQFFTFSSLKLYFTCQVQHTLRVRDSDFDTARHLIWQSVKAFRATIAGEQGSRSPALSPRQQDPSDVSLLFPRKSRPFQKQASEDMKRRRESLAALPSTHLTVGTPGTSETSNLVRMRSSSMGQSAPSLSSSMKELNMPRRGSRCTTRKPIISSTSPTLPRCHSPISHYSPVESPRNLSPCQQFLFATTRRGEGRRWSLASLPSSGYGTNTPGSSNVSISNIFQSQCSSQEKLHPLPSHSTIDERRHLSRFSSNESNPGVEEDGRRSPLMRSRSRSLSSPMRSPGMDSDIILMNSVYKERFPKATHQMEDRLEKFIEDGQELDPNLNSDAVTRFAHFQVIEMARDCLQKSKEKLVTSRYFYEMSENLEKLYSECREKSSTAAGHIRNLIKKLLLIVSRPARLLECLEFDPEDFYRLLEAVEGQAKVAQGVKTDIPQYIINKLGLNRDPLADLTTETITGDLGDAEPPDKNTEKQPEASIPEKQRTKPPSEEDFETIKLISNGAYGAVYLVRHKESRERFAMKKINKQNLVLRNQVEQAFAERDIMSFTDNPFVVGMFCTFETKKHLCMVMEYVEGGDCANLLKNMGPLPLDMARFYFAETVLAVEYLHSYGIVHRDLKPDNLLITAMGHIKLTDFGLSKIGLMNLATNLYEGCLDRETKLFNDKQVFGTPEYIAPEVILRRGYGKPVDWWSMGIILYEFLIGCVPFFGETPEKLFAHVINDEVEWPDEEDWNVPEDAKVLITQLLRQHPIDRLGTGGAHEVKEHSFFVGMDWESLLRQKAEFVPQLDHEEDTSYFDTRADRYNHEMEESEELDDTDDSSLFSSFSSCSPQFRRVYSCLEKELDEENLLKLAKEESARKTGSNTDINQSENAETGSSSSGEAANRKSASTPDLNVSQMSPRHSPSRKLKEHKNKPTEKDDRKFRRKELLPQLSVTTGKVSSSVSVPSIQHKPPPQPPENETGISQDWMKPKKNGTPFPVSPHIPIPSTSTLPIGARQKERWVTKSASASGLSLIISEAPTDEAVSRPVARSPGGSSTSSRDTSPNRETSPLAPQLKPPIIIRKGPRGFGFTARAIRVYFGDSDVYTLQHLVSAVDNNGPAFESGLRPSDLITHINGEPLQGLVHHQVLQLILSGGDRITIRTMPLESTTIKTGGRKRHPSSIKMVRRPIVRKRYGQGKRDAQSDRKRRATLLRRLSNKRASADLQHLVSRSPPMLTTSHSLQSLSRGAEIAPGSPTRKGPRSPPANRLCSTSESSYSAGNSSGSSSPSSSVPGSPAGTAQFQRPSSLHGLKHKLIQTFRSPRRKSVGHVPLSPLVRTPSPSSLHSTSPIRSPSPLAFPLAHHPATTSHKVSSGSTLTPTSSGKKIFMRPKSAEPGSPLLRRALSPDRLHSKSSDVKLKQGKLKRESFSGHTSSPLALSSTPASNFHHHYTSAGSSLVSKPTTPLSSFSPKKVSIITTERSQPSASNGLVSSSETFTDKQQDENTRVAFSSSHSKDLCEHGRSGAVREIREDTHQPYGSNLKLKTVDERSVDNFEGEEQSPPPHVSKISLSCDSKDRRTGIRDQILPVLIEDATVPPDIAHQSKEEEELKLPPIDVTMYLPVIPHAVGQKTVVAEKSPSLSVSITTTKDSASRTTTSGDIQNITVYPQKKDDISTVKLTEVKEDVSKSLLDTPIKK